MKYQKLRADGIFDGNRMLGSEAVLVLDEQGTVADLLENDAPGDAEKLDGLLIPGFINCHCHLELSHMRGRIPEKTGLVDFVFKVVTERHFSEETILDAIHAAENEMLAGGIVATGDICNNTHTLRQKQQQRMDYYNFIEVSGWLPEVAGTRLDKAIEILAAFEKEGDAPHNSLSPHAPYSVSEPLWELLQPYFPGKTITIHNQETSFEDELFISGQGGFSRMYEMMRLDTSFFKPNGRSSLQTYFGRLGNAARVILVHNTFTSEADIRFVQQSPVNTSWCLCVNANRYIEDALPPVDLLRSNGCSVVIGTDSLASNHALSVLDELRTIHRYFPHVPLEELLQWATVNGAAALQMDDRLGSFKPGYRPGVNLLTGIPNGKIGAGTAVTRLR